MGGVITWVGVDGYRVIFRTPVSPTNLYLTSDFTIYIL